VTITSAASGNSGRLKAEYASSGSGGGRSFFMAKHLPIPTDIGDYLEVDRSIPSGLRWKVSRGRVRAGQPACFLYYWKPVLYAVRFRKKTYLSHRVIFFLETGQDPGDLEIDHQNHGDNRDELRLVTRRQNSMNIRIPKRNQSGFKGVSWARKESKWRARIVVSYRKKHLGYFDSRLDAAWAYNQAAIEYYGEFAKLNVLLVQL